MNLIYIEDKHLNGVRNIMQEAFKEDAWSFGNLIEQINDINNYNKIIIENNEIIAYFITTIKLDFLEILSLAVSKKYRKQHVASQLMEKIIEYSKKIYMNKIILEVEENNNAAINLYKKFGFIEINYQKKYYQNKNAIIMMLKLGA